MRPTNYRVRADATAFVHRGESFLVQHLVVIGADATPAERGARDWLARWWALVHPWGSGGVYANFPDPDLPDWAPAYYGTNYSRLRRVKAASTHAASSASTSRLRRLHHALGHPT